MTPARWQQVDKIFQAVIELSPEKRAAFLDSYCGGDEELRREIESLISSDAEDLSLIDGPAFETTVDLIASHSSELTSGQQLGRYQIHSLLGAGGMGEVYLAQDTELRRNIAIKLLPTEYTKHQERLRRFQQEARAASALNHPNILTIHELGQIEGQQFIATEFVEGETLRDRLKRPLSLSEILEITIQIAGALAAAHKAGIIHRDIKPENIMLRHDGYVKVLDFGLAKLTEQREQPTHVDAANNVDISSGLLMGTVKYMSPEQARGEEVDPRSDIFSFGALLYEMIAGRVPFKGEDTAQLVKAILNDEPQRLKDYVPNTPEELQQVITKALSKDRTNRYQSVEELLIDLKSLKQKAELPTESQTAIGKGAGRTLSTQEALTATSTTVEFLVSRIKQHTFMTVAGFAGLAILLALVAIPFKNWIKKQAAPATQLKTTMLTATGHAMDPAISADGKYVAFRAEDGGLVSLRIKELATGNEIQITPLEGRFVFNPVFSRDGKYLYYEAIGDSPPKECPPGCYKNFWRQLYRRPVSGGSAEKIVDYLTSKITFSPDGNELAFIRVDLKERVDTLFIANSDGGQERPIISRKMPDYFQTDFYGMGPSWSPDGKHIAYVARDAGDGFDRAFEINLDTKVEKPVTFRTWGHGVADVTWLPDGGILFAAADTSMNGGFWRLSYPGGELQRLTNDSTKYMGLSVSADSSMAVTAQVADYIELWIAPDADASRARRVMPGRHDGRYGLAWTPNGKVVFTREMGGNSDIWIADRDGANQRELTTDIHQDVSPTVTSDGRYVLFESNRNGGDHIWRMDIDGSNQQQLTFGKVERQSNCSPDSKWVLYTSWDAGKPTPWKIPLEGGTPQQIANVQCTFPRVSHNGNLIACNSGGTRILILSFEGGQPVATVELPEDGYWDGSWTADDRGLQFGKNDRTANWGLYGTFNWWIQPIDGGPPKQLTFFKSDQPGTTTLPRDVWSADGKDLLYASWEIKSDLVMMTGVK